MSHRVNLPRLIALLIVCSACMQLATAGEGPYAVAKLYSRVNGTEVLVAIEIKIKRGWHLFHEELGAPNAMGIPTTVKMGGAGITWSKTRFPKPERLAMPVLDTWFFVHQGKVVLYLRGHLGAGATGNDITAAIDGQTCSEKGSCVLYSQSMASSGPGPDAIFADFPKDLVLATTWLTGKSPGIVTTNPGAPASNPRLGQDRKPDYTKVEFPEFQTQGETMAHGLGIWMLLAFVAGVFMNVMPCVLPVVSIKVLSFVQQAGEDRRRILLLGLFFGAGMLVVFWGLAAIAIGFGMNWGEQFQSQAFMVCLIAVVFAFALSLLGVFELGVPNSVNSLAGGVGREGLGDAFFKGMLATVLATPCSGPLLGSTLAWTLAQSTLTIFLVFTMLGLGMALPYVILTSFPSLLKFVPKPGAWMISFKQIMGFMLLATVVYLMISLRQDLLLFTNAFLVFVGLACWYWGRFAVFGQSMAKRLQTILVVLIFVAAGGHLSFVSLRGLFLEDKSATNDKSLVWEEFDPDRFAGYLQSGRNVFVDFSATWCPNCKYNEKVVFESKEVWSLFQAKNMVLFKADITHEGARTDMLRRLLKKLGGRSIPYLAVFPAGRSIEPFVRPDIVTVKIMQDILSALPDTEVKRAGP